MGDRQPWSEISLTTRIQSLTRAFHVSDKPGCDLRVEGRSEMLRDTRCRDRPEEMSSSNLAEGEGKGGEDPPSL